MSRSIRRPPAGPRVTEEILSLVVILIVFGLILALILAGYDPAVATGTAAAASLTAAELVRRLRGHSARRLKDAKLKENRDD